MSVYRPKFKDGAFKTPYFHFDFVIRVPPSREPQRFSGSTGQKKEAAARKYEERIRELAGLGKLTQLVTVEQACKRYLDEVTRHTHTERAKTNQELCMRELETFYGPDTLLVGITPDDVAKAASARAKTPVACQKALRLPKPSTVNRQVIEPMRRLLRRARKQWGVPIDLEQFQWGGRDGLKLKEPEGRKREMSASEEARFWEVLPGDYHDLCELYMISGKRQSNWLDLTRADVDLDCGRVNMRLLKKRRVDLLVLELTDRELEIISRAMGSSNSNAVFTAISQSDRDRGLRIPITARMLWAAVRKACSSAGIHDFRPHDFRHTFASRALRADPNIKKLQATMDHSSINSTLRYTHALQGDVKQMRAGVSVSRPASKVALPSKTRRRTV